MERGNLFGVKASSGELMIGTPRGVWTTRIVRRRPKEDRWSPLTAKMVGGVPWFEKREDLEESDEERELVFRPMTAEEREEEDRLYGEPEARSFPISRSDLEIYGYSSKCPGCRSLLEGQRAQDHTDRCRAIFKAAMAGEEKVFRAEERARNRGRRGRKDRNAGAREVSSSSRRRASAAGAQESLSEMKDPVPPAASERAISRSSRRLTVPMIGEDLSSEEEPKI